MRFFGPCSVWLIFGFLKLESSANPSLLQEKLSPKWTIMDVITSIPCLHLEGEISFQVLTNFQHVESGLIQIPDKALVDGNCYASPYDDYQDIKLSWNDTKGVRYSIYFGFVSGWESEFSDLTINSTEFALASVTVTYRGKENYSIPITYSISDFLAFSTPKTKTFRCSNIQLKEGDMIINFTNFQFRAFNGNLSTDFNNNFFECDTREKQPQIWNYVVQGLEYFFIGIFSFCLLGLSIILIKGAVNKRHDIIAIGYRIIGNGRSSM